MKIFHHIKAIVAGLLLSSSVVPVVMAEDIEIYTTPGANVSGAKPNLMFIIDGSLDMLVTSDVTEAYDPDTDYPGSCDSDFVYYTNDLTVPDCDGTDSAAPDYFKEDALECENALVTTQLVLDRDGVPVVDRSGIPTGETEEVDGPLERLGTFSGRLAHYGTDAWVTIDITRSEEREYTVECQSDSGIHGEDDSARTYIDDTNKYVSTAPASPHSVWSDGDSLLTLYSGNYVNYKNDTTVATVPESYFDQIREAIEYVVDGNAQVNISMMVLDQKDGGANDPGSEGGGIIYEMQDGSSPRGNFIPQMWSLIAEGSTPLSEAYYEALMYYGGKSVDYGTDASPPLVGSATLPSNTEYLSPIELSCQKNYIIVASNGKATEDDINATRQSALGSDGFTTGQCNSNFTDDPSDDNLNALASDGSTDDNCLDELAYWAANNDVAELAIDSHTGDQNIITHTVGFGYGDVADPDQIAGEQLLKDTADKGDGTFYPTNDKQGIRDAFDNIILNALKVNSTFSSPAVSVNAFNRSTHLDDLYFTLFKPTDGNHWEGNLKKYKLEFFVDTNDVDGDGDTTERLPYIAGQRSIAAIDGSTGFFSDDAQSFWSGTVDGKEVADGGAANEFTVLRNVYTYTGTYSGLSPDTSGDLTSPANAVDPTNTNLTDVMLDITTETNNSEEIVTGTTYRNTLINWASGLDALSDFGAVDTYDDVRPQMGDPLHAEPALVQYGETNGVAELVAYTATNDGYLHAIDVTDGSELWSFVPQELLPNLKIAMEDTGGDKLYGLDGSVVPWIHDANGDGTIVKNDGDHIYLYISMRRGGKNIYALDVTEKTNPELLWVIQGGVAPYSELGQTWSTVNVEKVVDGSAAKTVLIFGGGYDEDQDNATVTTEDSVGRTVYIADATTGARLWTAEADGTTPIANMNFSIPARIKPLDISGDGYVDRLYAVDMGGQMFRFDINNSNGNSLATSIIGGRIADLAEASTDVADRVAANARRFYYPPDIALIDAKDGPYHGLILSSGYRAHPLDDSIQDRIYMIKDRNTASISTVAGYNYNSSSTGPLREEVDLHNATSNLAGGDGSTDLVRDAELANITGAEGWYIYLDDEDNPGSWLGEKGLAEPLIIEGTAIVTTYTPNLTVSTTSCDPNIGLGKIYFLNILDATAAFPSNLDVRSDRHGELVRGGIPPTPNVIITKDGEPTLCVGTECQAADFGLGVRKTYWYEVSE
jgi:type IV pilus assembly protein PilY1